MNYTLDLTIVLLLFINISTSIAQDPIMDFNFRMREEMQEMSKKRANAFVVTWPQADPKIVAKNWKSYAKGLKGKLNYDRGMNEYFVDNGMIAGMENAVDITTKIEQKGEGVEMAFWFNAGVTYIQSANNPEPFQACEKLLRDFDSFVYAEILRDQVKEEEKVLKKMARDKRKVERVIKREERKIKKAERAIAKAEKAMEVSKKAIEENEQTIQTKEQEEAVQQQLIEKMKDKIKQVR
ncbi:MAG: hypothetical protein AB8E82_06985 [Aureispira sp.]